MKQNNWVGKKGRVRNIVQFAQTSEAVSITLPFGGEKSKRPDHAEYMLQMWQTRKEGYGNVRLGMEWEKSYNIEIYPHI